MNKKLKSIVLWYMYGYLVFGLHDIKLNVTEEGKTPPLF